MKKNDNSPIFVIPGEETPTGSYLHSHKNHPVNINFCTQIIKDRYYNGYGDYYPCIRFQGCNASWLYSQDKENIRDEDYLKILNRFS